MLGNILILPVIIPLFTASLTLFFLNSRRVQRIVGLAGAGAHLIVDLLLLYQVAQNGIQVIQPGNWPAPFGITFVADLFSAIMVTMAGIVGLTVAVYSLATINPELEHFGFHPLFHFLMMGVSGAFLTGDIFNLYVWFEVMLMSSFVLLALGYERSQMEGAIKYVTINLVSSAIFLAAVAILHGLAGTLNMADLARTFANVPEGQGQGVLTVVSMLFIVAFGIKAAVFPLFFWLPASYHTPPPAVSALFAGLLTKVGVYALIRVFTLIFIHDVGFTHTIILVISGFTMVTGVLGAVAQNEIRRVLSFHIVSQIGYMIMGLALFTPFALAASVFYIAHHIIVKTNLFLISGVVEHLGGSPELKKLGGLYQQQTFLAFLFLIPALSLAGIPPFSGFFAKLGLAQAGFAMEQYVIVGIAIAVSLLTLFSMTKIWNEAFWKPRTEIEPAPSDVSGDALYTRRKVWLIPIIALAAVTLMIGFGAGPIFELALEAGEELMDPAGYIQVVLGGP